MTKPNLAQLRRLVGNPDSYSVMYLSDGQVGWRTERKALTDAVLAKHLKGEHTVGTYIGHKVDGHSISHTLVFDVDSGIEALAETKRIQQAVLDLGFPLSGFATEFSGNKGYHIWLPLQEWRPNAELRRIGRAVLALAGVQCEVYPKQDEVRDLGNLVKLPGGVHLKTGKPNDFVGSPPLPVTTAVWERILGSLAPEQKARRAVPADNRFPCLGLIQEGVSEGGRNNQLFHLATMLRRNGVADDVLEVALAHVNAKCEPPLDDGELEQLLESSRMSGPICDQLPGKVREECGDYCIRELRKGLKLWPGDIRNGEVGGCVVVRLAARDANTVTLEHDDLATAKGRIR